MIAESTADKAGRTRDGRSLRHRIAITLAVFGAVLSLCLAGGIYLLSHDLEAQLIDDTLRAELDDLIERRQRNPFSVPEHTATIRAYVIDGRSENVPTQIAALTPGHHQLTLDNHPYRATVRILGTQRYVVLYDVSALQRRERVFILLLTSSVILFTLISAASGRWLASRVIAPLNELVSRVATLTPDQPNPRLAEQFPWTEVRQLAAEFDHHLERLQAFVDRERLFTGDVSHELRTPLSVASGAAELLLQDPGLSPKVHERAGRLARAITEMSEMTGALLALAREQNSDRPNKPECDVAEVVEDLVQRHRVLIQQRPIELLLNIQARPRLSVDRAEIAMVFGNLLRNALNFTSEGQVQVVVQGTSIEVLDTGCGIDGQDVANLFRPYVQGMHSKGSGLGLSLVQRLCERNAWDVELSQLSTGGTRACLTLQTAFPIKEQSD